MKIHSLHHLLSVVFVVSYVPHTTPTPIPPRSNTTSHGLPTRTIAGVSVVDTALVRDAQAFARLHSSDFVYKHIMRSWLFGTLMIDADETISGAIDREVHAVAALLHDLGWDHAAGSPLVSANRRFEVDGAVAARDFIRGHADGGAWDHRRLQLVWDAIALHSEHGIAYFKELEVEVVSKGIDLDFTGPMFGVAADDYDAVVGDYPNGDLSSGFNDTIVWLCQTKPNSTYDSWQQPFGDAFVPGYSANRNRVIDQILGAW